MTEEVIDDYNQYTDSALVDLWEEYLVSYQLPDQLAFYYLDKILNLRRDNKRSMAVDYQTLIDYRVDPKFMTLRYLTSFDPEKSRKLLREAILRILKEKQPDFYQDIEKKFKAEFSNAELTKEIPSLNTDDIGHLLKVIGLVTTIDEKSSTEVYSIAWICEQGHVNIVHGPQKPTKCKGSSVNYAIPEEEEAPGEREIIPCDSTHFTRDDKKCRMEDYIKFDVQQRSETTSETRTPASINIEVKGHDIVDWVKNDLNFGQLVAISGIPRTDIQKYQSAGGKMIAHIYMEGSDIEVVPETYIDDDPVLEEIVADTVRHSLDPNENLELEHSALEKLIESICPSLYMTPSERLIKELILMLMAGSDSIRLPDGTRARGEGQLMVIGDPGLGKSTIADYVRQVKDRTMYNAASKSTSVGLVGGHVIDKDGNARITPGVFGLAKGGCVILDEFAGRPDKDYADLLEPLSDMQTVTIAKGAFYRRFQTNASVLAIANPSTQSRYYNPEKSIFDNTKIPSTIMQRFDVVLIKRDIANVEDDKARVDHFLKSRAKGVSEEEFNKQRPDKWKRRDENYYSADYMKKYFRMIRRKYHPEFTNSREACQVLSDWYTRIRQMSITISEEGAKSGGRDVTIPAGDMRKVGAVIRFAQMRARVLQRDYVTKEDAEWSCMCQDITLAEAGMWKQGSRNERDFASDTLAEYNRKKAVKDAEIQRATFKKIIQDISFEKCYACKGGGEVIEVGGEHIGCQNCKGIGRNPVEFSINDAILDGVGNEKGKLPAPIFNQIWKEWEDKNDLVPGRRDGYYINTTHWAGTIGGVKQKSEKERLKEKMMRDNPGLWKRFQRDSKD